MVPYLNVKKKYTVTKKSTSSNGSSSSSSSSKQVGPSTSQGNFYSKDDSSGVILTPQGGMSVKPYSATDVFKQATTPKPGGGGSSGGGSSKKATAVTPLVVQTELGGVTLNKNVPSLLQQKSIMPNALQRSFAEKQRQLTLQMEQQRQAQVEKNRIESLKEEIKKKGGQTRTQEFSNAVVTTTKVDRLDKGVKTQATVIEIKDKKTGQITTRTYEYKPDEEGKKVYHRTGGIVENKEVEIKVPAVISIYKKPTMKERINSILLMTGFALRQSGLSNNIKYFGDVADNQIKIIEEVFGHKKDLAGLGVKTINLLKNQTTDTIIKLTSEMNNELKNAKSNSEINLIKRKYQEKIKRVEEALKIASSNIKKRVNYNISLSVLADIAESSLDSVSITSKLLTNKEWRDSLVNGIKKLATDKEAQRSVINNIKNSFSEFGQLYQVSKEAAFIVVGGQLIQGYFVGKVFKPVKFLKLAAMPLKNFKIMIKVGGIIGKGVMVVKRAGKNVLIISAKGVGKIGYTVGRGISPGLTEGLKFIGKAVKTARTKLPVKIGGKVVYLKGKQLENYVNLKKQIISQQNLEKVVSPILTKTTSAGVIINPSGKIPTQQVQSLALQMGRNIPVNTLRSATKMNVIVNETPLKYLKKVIQWKLNKKVPIPYIKEIEKTIYQKTFSFSFYNSEGKYLFTATTSLLSNAKKINLPRNLTPFEAIKLVGTNKQFILSRAAGAGNIKSYTVSINKNIISDVSKLKNKLIKEYITKYKKLPSDNELINILKTSTKRVFNEKSSFTVDFGKLRLTSQVKIPTSIPTGRTITALTKRPFVSKIEQGGIKVFKKGYFETVQSIKKISRVIDDIKVSKEFRKGLKLSKSLQNFGDKLEDKAKLLYTKLNKQSKALAENFKKELSMVQTKKDYIRLNSKYIQDLNNLKIKAERVLEQISKEKYDLRQKIKEVAASQVQTGIHIKNKFSQRGIVSVAREQARLRDLTRAVIKARAQGTIKTAIATVIISQIKNANSILLKVNPSSSKEEVKSKILPAYNQAVSQVQKQLTSKIILPTVPIPRIIPRTPPKKPIIETPIPIPFKLPEGMSNLIRVNNGYGGYVVAGRIPGRVRQLNRLPLTLESSLSIGTYFALNTPKGYSILKKSPQKVTKQTLERYPNISRDFFRKNKNKIAIIKKGNSLVIKRK